MMDKDIVLVSINYRLGILGFLSTEDDVIPGNNGMKDQVLALKWVRENIASFGGNPNSVTIIGLSAGGGSVHLHYLSPLSRDLFHRGVAQSGTALAPWAIQENPLERARKLATLVGCSDKNTKKLKRCLKQRPVENLLKQMKHFYGYDMMPIVVFGPVIERGVARPFLDVQPHLLLQTGNVADLPLIISYTADDGLLPAALYWSELNTINEKWGEVSPYLLDYNYTLIESRRNAVSREVLDYYDPGNQYRRITFTQMFTDRYYGIPAEMAAKMQAKVTKSAIYFYLFNYREGENKAVTFLTQSEEVEGVSHGEDVFYFYGSLLQKPFSEQDIRLKNACQNAFYSFFTTGKPSFDGSDTWKSTEWSELTYLNITGPDDMKLQKTKCLHDPN